MLVRSSAMSPSCASSSMSRSMSIFVYAIAIILLASSSSPSTSPSSSSSSSPFLFVVGQLPGSSIPLIESHPIPGYVAAARTWSTSPQYSTYYAITIPSTLAASQAAGIVVNVTPIGDGNPDLFADWTEFPSSITAPYRGRSWGEDSVFVPRSAAVGHPTLFVTVAGSFNRAANYTIVYQISLPVTLYDGQGQYSFGLKNAPTYFSFAAGPNSIGLTFSLAGRGKIYVGTTNPLVPTGSASNAIWVSNYFSSSIKIAAGDARWPTDALGSYYVAVITTSDAYYTITASLNGTATELTAGVAIDDQLDLGASSYYTYSVGTAGCQLQLLLSVIFGDPDLFVSQTVVKPNIVTCPTSSAACNTSTHWGGDAITFDPATVGTYYIGVSGETASSYTLLAQSVCPDDSFNSSATLLVDGVAQYGSLPVGSHRYYSFAAPTDPGQDITFTLSAPLGDPDMYITSDGTVPTTSGSTWYSQYEGDDSIVIRSTDANACIVGSACLYFILVDAATDCQFYLSASTPVSEILLFEGVPQSKTLQASQLQYYAISLYVRVWQLKRPIVISVTDLSSGNPNLYVSRTNEPKINPSDAATYIWSAARWADDSVNIFPSDANYCIGLCTYYVAVLAVSTTSYSIVFHMDQPTSLLSGVPQQGIVPASAYNFYSLRVNPGYGQVQISLVTRTGFANILVSNSDVVLPNLLNSTTYQEYVPWYRGATQLITINEGTPGACQVVHFNPTYCSYLIGIQGFYNASYTITGVINSARIVEPVRLASGTVQPGTVTSKAFQYYKFDVLTGGQTLNIVVTATAGDPDLYVATGRLPLNTNGRYNYSSVHTGGDSVSIVAAPLGTYFIGVYGWSTRVSTYTVLATMVDPNAAPGGLGDVAQLNDGETQSGYLPTSGTYSYYMITIGDGFDQLFFALAKISGDPDMYVRYDPISPPMLPVGSRPSSYAWKATSYGDDTIKIVRPMSGVYTVGVLAYRTSTHFVISAATGQAIQQLSDGVPRRGAVNQYKYSYFRIHVDAPSDLAIVVTPYSGDPDLYISNTNDRPNKTSTGFTWSSTAFSTDSYTILSTDVNACSNCWYYVGVYGFFSSTFLITASVGNEIVVQNGVPVDGSAAIGKFVRYTFDMSTITSGSVVIDVAALSGLPSLYVDMTGQTSIDANTAWSYSSAAQYSGSRLTIDAYAACNLPNATNPCIMHIAIHADWWSTSYTLSISTGDINLINGRSVMASLALNAYAYYVITVPDYNMDLVITVQSFTGDADLFVSNNSTLVHPNNTASMWASRATGLDTVALHMATPGDYYIGVLGYSATRYSLTAYAYYENSTMVPLQLQDGVPQSAVLAMGDSRQYMFQLTGVHADVSFIITNSLGDPDLYVTMDPTSPPAMNNYQWSSTRFGSDTLTIQSPTAGTYFIGVYASSTTSFTIAAVTHEGTLELVAGLSFSEDLFQGQTEYFITQVTDTSKALTVTVTSMNGDPDLYISDVTSTPGPNNNTFSATSYRNDSITILSSQLHLGVYYIAVFAYFNCSFTIVASYDSSIQLQSGRPQHAAQLKESSKSYTFRVDPQADDVTIALTPIRGYARVYVATQGEPDYRNAATYQWSSMNPFSSQMIIIPGNDTNACKPPALADPFFYCTYFILVRAMTDCEYSLNALNGRSGVDLQQGIPQQATVAYRKYQHFRFRAADPQADLAFSVTPISGDPDIYIATAAYDPTNIGASKSLYQWKSELIGGDTIRIAYDDTRFKLGEWEISVYGATYSTFVVVALASPRNGNTSMISLVDGLPIGSRLWQRGSYDYYSFTPSDPTSSVSFALSPRYGNPDLYISMSTSPLPSSRLWQWMSSHTGSDFITINGADVRSCGGSAYAAGAYMPCTYIIAVKAFTGTQYTITVTSAMVTGQLQSGIPVYGQAAANQFTYYYIFVSSFGQPILQFSLTAISGDPDIYVSTKYPHPNATANEYYARRYGSEELTIVGPTRTTYYVGVLGYSNCSFSLTATFADPPTLSPGQPFTDSIATYDQSKYYQFHIETGSSDAPSNGITVSINAAVNGYIDMFVANDGSVASASNYQWRSLATSPAAGRQIVIAPIDNRACWTGSNCTYSLAVHMRSGGLFLYTVTVFYGDNIVTLQPSQAFLANVPAGQFFYFRSMVSSTAQDISISTTQFVGQISLYVSQTENNPNQSNFTWIAYANNTHMAILATDPLLTPGYLWIAAYGETDASFSIVATNDNTLLLSGTPQSSMCSYAAPTYYFLNFQQSSIITGGDPSAQTDIIIAISSTHNRRGLPSTGAFAVYITTDISQSGNTKPDATHNIWSTILTEGQTFRIPPHDPNYCQSTCTFFIAVGCPTDAMRGGFTITASTADSLEVLTVNTMSTGIVPAKGNKYYHVYLASAQNITFTLEPCAGEVDLYISTVFNRPDSTPGNSEDSRTSHTSVDSYTYVAPRGSLPISSLFFGVQPTSTTSLAACQFNVRTSYAGAPASTAPTVTNSLLVTSALEAGTVRFTFSPATSVVGTAPENLIYTMYWTLLSDANAIMYTQCGVDTSRSSTNNVAIQYTNVPAGARYTAALTGLSDDVYQFNIFVSDPSSLSSGTSAYSVSQAQPNGVAPFPPRAGWRPNPVLLGIGIPLALAFIAAFIYLCVKNRKLTRELAVEMHDVPSAASGVSTRSSSSSSSSLNSTDSDSVQQSRAYAKASRGAPVDTLTKADKAKNFHTLLNDDEESSDRYSAPHSASVDEL